MKEPTKQEMFYFIIDWHRKLCKTTEDLIQDLSEMYLDYYDWGTLLKWYNND
jgi:hypothetical protein